MSLYNGTVQAQPILNRELPHDPWRGGLPGTAPLSPADWLVQSDVFGPQMQLRDRLIARHPQAVIAAQAGSGAAQGQLLRSLLGAVACVPGYDVADTRVSRPDGAQFDCAAMPPLPAIGRLAQEDFCILQPDDAGQMRLTAAVLCFPAGWHLAAKLGQRLAAIHAPVAAYTENIALRVNRLMTGLRPGMGLTRTNGLLYNDFHLFQPKLAPDPPGRSLADRAYVRSERQCLLRLPESDAVVFSIHTYLVENASLSDQQRAGRAGYVAAMSNQREHVA